MRRGRRDAPGRREPCRSTSTTTRVAASHSSAGSWVTQTMAHPAARCDHEMPPQRGRRRGIEPGERLVEEQQARLVQHGPGNRQPLQHAAGKGRNPPVDLGGQSDLVERHGDPLGAVGQVVQGSGKAEVLAGGEIAVEMTLMGEQPDGAAGRRVGVHVEIEDPDRTALRMGQPGETAEQRRLAGAVGAEEQDQLAGVDRGDRPREVQRPNRSGAGAPRRRRPAVRMASAKLSPERRTGPRAPGPGRLCLFLAFGAEEKQVVELGKDEQEFQFLSHRLEHDLLAAFTGVTLHHDQRAQPRGIDLGRSGKIHDQAPVSLPPFRREGRWLRSEIPRASKAPGSAEPAAHGPAVELSIPSRTLHPCRRPMDARSADPADSDPPISKGLASGQQRGEKRGAVAAARQIGGRRRRWVDRSVEGRGSRVEGQNTGCDDRLGKRNRRNVHLVGVAAAADRFSWTLDPRPSTSHDRSALDPPHRRPPLSAPSRLCPAGAGPAGTLSGCRDGPAAILGRSGRRAGVVQAVARGAGMEAAPRPVVRGRKTQCLVQLPRPARPRAAPQPGGVDLGRRTRRPPGAHLLGSPSRSLPGGQRAQSAGRGAGRPGGDLPADGGRSGSGDAGVRADRRGPFGSVRGIFGRIVARSHQRRQSRVLHHRRRRLPAGPAGAAQAICRRRAARVPVDQGLPGGASRRRRHGPDHRSDDRRARPLVAPRA